MKRFEHEVKTFKNGSKRDDEKIQNDLHNLGLAGWEVVSVIACDLGAREIKVFLKRQLDDDVAQQENAA